MTGPRVGRAAVPACIGRSMRAAALGLAVVGACSSDRGDQVETVYRSRRAGDAPREIELRLRARSCDNGMAVRVYPMTARLTIGDLTLEGCAERPGEAGDARRP